MTLDGGTILLIVGGLCVLCLVGIVLSVGFQIFGVVFNLLGGVLEFVFGIFGGSPCGCILVIGGLIVCGGLAWLLYSGLQTCGTPQAVNFCGLLGR
jgi:hypothetical protein